MDNFNQPTRKLISMMRRMRKLRVGDMPREVSELTFPQMALLRRVSLAPGCHIRDIAIGMKLSAPTVSVGIRRLVEAGFLERQPDLDDKRASRIYLSSKGKELQRRAMQLRYKATQQFLSGLNDKDQEQFLTLLESAVQAAEANLSKD